MMKSIGLLAHKSRHVLICPYSLSWIKRNPLMRSSVALLQRYLSVNGSDVGQAAECLTLLDSGQHHMHQFGKVKVQGSIDLHITPNLDTAQYVNNHSAANYLLYGPDNNKLDTSTCDFTYCTKDKILSISYKEAKLPLKCYLELPVKCDLHLRISGTNDVHISNMECSNVDIELDAGDCYLKNNKTTTVRVESQSGNITSYGVLQGDINLIAKKAGTVSTEKLQGSHVTMCTENGNVTAKSVYTDKCEITTNRGKIHIGNFHKRAKVNIKDKGNLVIDSLDGNLLAFIMQGNADVYISRHEVVHIRSGEGDIYVRVPPDLSTTVELCGDKIDIEENVNITETQRETKNNKMVIAGEVNEHEDQNSAAINNECRIPVLHAETGMGTVSLKCQDWFSSLKLKLPQE